MSNVEEQQNKEIEEIQANVSEAMQSIDPDDHHIPVPQQLVVAIGLLLLIFSTSYIPQVLDMMQPEDLPAEVTPIEVIKETEEVTEVPTGETERIDPFAELEITGASAYVWDVKAQKAIYKKNSDEQLPLASVTKLMTGLVAFELLSEDTSVHITTDAIYQEGDSGLLHGETFSKQDLLDLTLISSSNDGAYALAAAAGNSLMLGGDNARTFIEAMNIRAEELGLVQTYFRNPTGLDVSTTEAGAYGSARDMSFLMEYILTNYPEVLELTTQETARINNEAGAYHDLANTNQTVDEITGLIGSKTGYTELAGGNLVIAFDAGLNRPIVVTVLGSTRSGRFRDTLVLTEAARAYVNQE